MLKVLYNPGVDAPSSGQLEQISVLPCIYLSHVFGCCIAFSSCRPLIIKPRTISVLIKLFAIRVVTSRSTVVLAASNFLMISPMSKYESEVLFKSAYVCIISEGDPCG